MSRPSSVKRIVKVMGMLLIGTLIAISLVLGINSASAQTPASPKAMKWRMQHTYPGGFQYDGAKKYFCDPIRKASNGRLEIALFPGGALYPIFEAHKYAGQGMVEGSFTCGAFVSGISKMLNFEFALVSDPRTVAEIQDFYIGRGYMDILRKVYAEKFNVYYLGQFIFPPYQLISKVPIKSVADIKGLKIKTSGLLATTFAKLGARVVTLPPEETYMAFAQGVIDAAAWGTAAETVDLKLHEVAKYWITPGVSGNLVTCGIVNLDKWKALPDDLKEIVQLAAANLQENTWREFSVHDAAALQIMKNAGVKTSHIPPDEIAKLSKAGNEAMWEYAKGDADSLKFLETYQKQLKDLGYIH